VTKILIVEDDSHKRDNLVNVVRAVKPDADMSLAHSYRSALSQLLAEPPDLMILDMSLPTFDISGDEAGGRHRTFAGRDILFELRRRNVHVRAIIVTQYQEFGERRSRISLDALTLEMESAFGDVLVCVVHYAASQSSWEDELGSAIRSSLR